jgi:Asp-tRNA(Asn)/Glu-tRNA(Gln) amidotransferase A subunit family amidase
MTPNVPLHRLGAAEAVRRLARREFTAEALLRDCLARIDEREGEVQAFVARDDTAALAAARALDRGPWQGPLHGLPLGVKDLFDAQGLPSSYGSPIHAGHRPDTDAAVVALCRSAGAVVAGKTVTTEFATFHPGPTRNPVDPLHTPGGSSSGSAAAVADAMLPLALGTQTAGSIVRPAAFCGVVGFKPSYGRVPRAGMKLLSESLDTIGGFGRCVEDVALLASVLCGDPVLAEVPRPGSPRIGCFLGPHADALAPESIALWERAVARLRLPGSRATPVATPEWFAESTALQTGIMCREASQSLAWEFANHRPQISPALTAMLDRGAADGGDWHARRLAALAEARQRAAGLFIDHDILIAPSTAGEAPLATEGTGDPLWCRAWTALGLPCLHLPLGRGPQGLPIGLQLIGPPMGDLKVLQAGALLLPRLAD